MKYFKEWLKENYPEDDQEHVFSDKNDWPGVSFRPSNPTAQTQIYSQDTIILKKINELEYRIDNLEKQIPSRA